MRTIVAIIALAVAAPAGAADRIWTEGPLMPGVREDTPMTFGTFSRLAALTSPAVVSIETTLRKPWGAEERGAGSGFIIRADGYILSNNHVVEGAVRIEIHTADGTSLRAEVVGTDPATDLSVLKVDVGKGVLPVVPLGDSDELKIGEWVVAIGNPLNLSHTVTTGIVSAKGRREVRPDMRLRYRDFIQTDASINPGNSGGPLFNLRGEVVGINTAIHAQGQGIGFAIPINMVKTVVPMLVRDGRVARSWLGVNIEEVTLEQARSSGLDRARGALINNVEKAGPADEAGLERGDIIVDFDGTAILRHDDLPWLASTAGIGRTVSVDVVRAGERKTLQVKLGEQSKRHRVAKDEDPAFVLGMKFSSVPRALARELSVTGGVLVTAVEGGSAAASAGVRAGDVVLRHDNVPIRRPEKLVERLRRGTGEVRLLIERKTGKTFVIFSR